MSQDVQVRLFDAFRGSVLELSRIDRARHGRLRVESFIDGINYREFVDRSSGNDSVGAGNALNVIEQRVLDE